MKIELEKVLPSEIERRSFEIIESEMKKSPDPLLAPIIKRVVHTTADFDFVENLRFSPGAVQSGIEALKNGAGIVTDTQMTKAGINKRVLSALGCTVHCFIADEDIAATAAKGGITRAAASMEKAANLQGELIFAIGNAPTALIRLYELIKEGRLSPALVIGAPVGFVNVVQAKELIMRSRAPYIVAEGRKGGSAVAAAIVNALLYEFCGRA